MLRIVLDTNVLVSALIDDKLPRQLLRTLFQEHNIILSFAILEELNEVLKRDKFGIKRSRINQYISMLTKQAKVIQDKPRFNVILDDPDDDIIFNVAYHVKADYIVTGDKHLLALKRFKQTQIVTVSELTKILSEP
jgi:putative PIN family toxin of toxin-antitoxin system